MILGITGKTGVGKHSAAQFFEQRNWEILDADKLAHRLYHPYQRVWREVVERFGEGILKTNDVIDRQKLKFLVFADSDESRKALADLNAIVHPELKRVLNDEVYFLKKKKKNTVVLAALWEELELFELCDKVILIQCSDDLTYERVKKRDGISRDMFNLLTTKQNEPTNADFKVTNEGEFMDLYKQLNSLLPSL